MSKNDDTTSEFDTLSDTLDLVIKLRRLAIEGMDAHLLGNQEFDRYNKIGDLANNISDKVFSLMKKKLEDERKVASKISKEAVESQ